MHLSRSLLCYFLISLIFVHSCWSFPWSFGGSRAFHSFFGFTTAVQVPICLFEFLVDAFTNYHATRSLRIIYALSSLLLLRFLFWLRLCFLRLPYGDCNALNKTTKVLLDFENWGLYNLLEFFLFGCCVVVTMIMYFFFSSDRHLTGLIVGFRNRVAPSLGSSHNGVF